MDEQDTLDDPTALERPQKSPHHALADALASTHDRFVVPDPPHETDDPVRPPGSRIGHYVVDAVLGRGGMSVVYSARDSKLGRKVAIKVLRSHRASDPRLGNRLLREAKAMAKLSHANVVTVYEAGTVGDEIYIAMELVRGRTLGTWLAEAPRSWRAIVDVFVEAGRGLSAAHAVGVVHRDFKPDNVLIDHEGRVRVSDFGIARQHDELDWDSNSVVRGSLDPALTGTNELIGTPLYMSPEQFRLEPAGPESDQFSFCVALYEALYGTHPFVADANVHVSELFARVPAGERTPVPKHVGVPRWLRTVLEQGLAVEPGARFPSMAELLAQLARRPRSRRPVVAAGLAVVALGAVGGWYAALGGADECASAGGDLASLWSPARRVEIERAFRGTKVGFAEQTWHTVSSQLDAHVLELTALEQQACRARDPLHEQRVLCVADRRRELATLLDLFAHADAGVVEHAVKAVESLDLRACTDPRSLSVSVPADPALRAQIDEARELVSEAELNLASGRFGEALQLSSRAIATARTTGYAPVVAASLIVGGRVQWYRADMQASRTLFREAVTASERGHDDVAKAQALTWLVQVIGTELADYSTAEDLGDMADAAIARAGGDSLLLAQLEFHRGMMALKRGRATDALAHHQRALQLRLVELGRDHGDVGATRILVGSSHHMLGHLDEALRQEREALRIITARHGAGHPLAANALTSIGNVLLDKGKTAHAIETYLDAIGRLERSVGPNHPDVALTLSNLATALLSDERATDTVVHEAIAHYRRALEIEQARLGPEHKEVAATLLNLGRAQLRLRGGAAAIASLEAALAIFARHAHYGGDVAELRFELAKACARAGRAGDAIAHGRGAAEAYTASGRAREAAEVTAWLERR